MFSSLAAVRAIPLVENSVRNVEAMTPITGKEANFVGLDFDAQQGFIYYADVRNDVIWRRHVNGSQPEMVLNRDIRSVEGLAFDWIGRNMYFTDGSRGVIEVVKVTPPPFTVRRPILTGTRTCVLKKHRKNSITSFKIFFLVSDLAQPRAVAVHPVLGAIFWSEWSRSSRSRSRIARANLDGTNTTTIRDREVGWPNGLAIDVIQERIWWVDALLDAMFNCALDGSDVRPVRGTRLVHPFGLALDRDFVYFSDWRLKGIVKMNKTTPSE